MALVTGSDVPKGPAADLHELPMLRSLCSFKGIRQGESGFHQLSTGSRHDAEYRWKENMTVDEQSPYLYSRGSDDAGTGSGVGFDSLRKACVKGTGTWQHT